MSGWTYLTAKERELLLALVADGIEVQRLLQHDMLLEGKDPRQIETDIDHFIDVILDTEEPLQTMEGLQAKLEKGGGEPDGR
jgi:hypothetical protein